MFNLEQSIAEWRKEMIAAGIKPLSPLEELECHLREEIEKQIKFGTGGQEAFEMAVKAIGQGGELKKEFKKLGEPLEVRLVKLIGIGCSTVAFLFSLWILPFLFSLPTGSLARVAGGVAVASIILGWIYNYKFLPVVRSRHLRAFIGFVCCVVGIIGIQLFILHVVPNMLIHPAGTEERWGRFMTVFLWAWAVMAWLGSIGYGLERAAREDTTVANT